MYRPTRLSEFIGQKNVVTQARMVMEASRARGEPLPHILLSGTGGTGKTTLAEILATEMGHNLIVTSPAALTKNEDLYQMFKDSMGKGLPIPVIFLDEIHRLNIKVEEDLYQPMERRRFVRKKPSGKMYDMYPWTLIGATTNPGRLTEPFRNRFGLHLVMEPYTEADMVTIIKQAATKNNYTIDDKAVEEIAIRCRMNPRVANNLLDRCNDLSIVRKAKRITWGIAVETFSLLDIDEYGLNNTDRKYIATLYALARPVGADSLVPATGMDRESIVSSIEPYLVQIGFVALTGRGRMLTDEGNRYVQDFKIVRDVEDRNEYDYIERGRFA